MYKISICLTVACALLFACGDDSAERAREQARQQFVSDSLALKVAVTPTLDCLPLYVAAEHGLFDRAGVSVLLRPFQAQMDQDTAVQRGHVEGLTTDSVRAAYLAAHGTPLRTVAHTSLKWQLVTNKSQRIKQLSQLDDKMLAMTRYSATDMLAQKAVDSAGLQPERVFRIQVNDIGIRLSMLETGVMDAMLLPEPQAAQARLAGHPVLMDTEQMGLRLGVIAFTEAAMADTMRQQQVERFLKVYDEACDSVAQRGLLHYRDLIVDYCHVKPETVDSMIENSTTPTP